MPVSTDHKQGLYQPFTEPVPSRDILRVMRHAGVVQEGNRPAAGAQRDFFVSHAGHDRAWAEWVAWHLIDAGYTVELDCWDWAAGDNFVTKMGDALQNARRVLALFSPAYFEPSRYTTDEWSAALVKDEDGGHRLLPARIESCDVPRLLQPLLWADLYGVAEDEALRRLLAAARGPVARQGGRRSRPAGPVAAPRRPMALPPGCRAACPRSGISCSGSRLSWGARRP